MNLRRLMIALSLPMISASAIASHVEAPMPALQPEVLASELSALPEGSVEKGRAVHNGEFCASCHGSKGISTTANWPHVAGQPHRVTEKALLDYKAGRRTLGAQGMLMTSVAKHLTKEQIADVAALYESLPGPDGRKLTVGKKFSSGSGLDVGGLVRNGDPQRALTPCAACHGSSGKGRTSGLVPVLHGQNPTYVANQLKDYSEGVRSADVLDEMRFFARYLTDEEMLALARYYGELEGKSGSCE